MTTESLLAVSIGIGAGLLVVAVTLAVSLMVTVSLLRGKRDDVEELRVQVLALRQEIAAQRHEFTEALAAIREFSRDR